MNRLYVIFMKVLSALWLAAQVMLLLCVLAAGILWCVSWWCHQPTYDGLAEYSKTAGFSTDAAVCTASETEAKWWHRDSYDSPAGKFEIVWGRTQRMCCVPVPMITPLNHDFVRVTNEAGEEIASLKWPDMDTGVGTVTLRADGEGIITGHRDGKVRYFGFDKKRQPER